jgi:hypothetical protein
VILLTGFIPVAGPCFYSNISVGCKALQFVQCDIVSEENVLQCSGYMESAGSSAAFIGRTCLPDHTASYHRIPVFSTFNTTRTSFNWRRFEELVAGALNNCPGISFGSLTFRCWVRSSQRLTVSQRVMVILNVACLCATPSITSFEYQCVVGRAESCYVTAAWTIHPSLLMNGTGLQGA